MNNIIRYKLLILPILLTILTHSCKLFNSEENDDCIGVTLPRIAFLRDRDTTNDATIRDNDIWIMDRNSCNQTQLTFGLNVWNYTFSPDGQKICFLAGENNISDIFIMNSDGSDIQKLTNDNLWYQLPIFTPNGSKLVGIIEIDNDNYDVMIIDINGDNKLNLTDSPSIIDFDVNITPDGTKLIFISSSGESYSDVFKMDIDGTNKECITCQIDENIIYSPSNPLVTSDNDAIIFINRYGKEIGKMKFDGSTYEKIFEVQNYNRIWSFLYDRINQYIIFSETDGQNLFETYKFDLIEKNLINLKESYDINGVQSIFPDENLILYTQLSTTNTKSYKLFTYDFNNHYRYFIKVIFGHRYKFQPNS